MQASYSHSDLVVGHPRPARAGKLPQTNTSVQCQRPSIHSAPTVSVGLHANQIRWPQPVQMFSASLYLYMQIHHPSNRLAALTSVTHRTHHPSNRLAALTSVTHRTHHPSNRLAALTSVTHRTHHPSNRLAALTNVTL